MLRHDRLDGGETSLVWASSDGGAPRLVYLGRRLPTDTELPALDRALERGPRESTPDEPVPATLLPTTGWGWMGEPALAGWIQDRDGAFRWDTCRVEAGAGVLTAHLRDNRLEVEATISWRMDTDTGVLAADVTFRNAGQAAVRLATLASLCLPLPPNLSEILSVEGDWAREGQPQRFAAPPGVWSRVNRTGRTGFARSTLCLADPSASDQSGLVLAIHLGWSGAHRLGVDTRSTGDRLAFVGWDLAPGEISLAPGDTLTTPTAYAVYSQTGLQGVSDAFHAFVRKEISPNPAQPSRRVHFNSWEAVYFDLDQDTLMDLAASAADLGVERFVLDDGWFLGRRNDRSSLGDWRVDPKLFPEGLDPLIEHVHALGMDFGLWVEPEMVSPDSELYRAHPDWCLHAPGAPRPTMRHQLWLDMSRADVRDHLFGQVDALLTRHRIAYLKWDCNRDVFPAVSGGHPTGVAQVRGTYALLDRLRAAHPTVEIESCASGGARMDLEILKRTKRLWTSDTTDAIERIRIQRWASLVLPPEVLGAHVGPSPNPITGRRLPIELRARVALFGHLGVEADPRRLTPEEREILADHIALWKRMRHILSTGRLVSWTTDDGADARLLIGADGSEAWLLACRAGVAPSPASAPLRISGLDPAARYRIMPLAPWPRLAARRLADPEGWRAGKILSGATLAQSGLALPLSDPETAWLFRLERLQ